MRQIDTLTDIFESQKQVVSNTQASKPGVPGQRRSLLFCLFEPKIKQKCVPCEGLYFLSFVGHAFTRAVIGQSPSIVVVRYPHHTPLQWAE